MTLWNWKLLHMAKWVTPTETTEKRVKKPIGKRKNRLKPVVPRDFLLDPHISICLDV